MHSNNETSENRLTMTQIFFFVLDNNAVSYITVCHNDRFVGGKTANLFKFIPCVYGGENFTRTGIDI